MTNDNTYNGWTNYATWRVNLEIFDGLDPREMGWQRLDTYDLGQCFKEYAEEILESDIAQHVTRGGGTSLAMSYALAFIQDVNWTEIAKHKIEEYADDESEAA